MAGLINAARVVKENLKDLKVIINGVGSVRGCNSSITFAAGIKNITFVDIDGPVHVDSQNYNHYQTDLVKQSADQTPYKNLSEAVKDRDVFIGLSDADVLTSEQVKTMAKNPIIFCTCKSKA